MVSRSRRALIVAGLALPVAGCTFGYSERGDAEGTRGSDGGTTDRPIAAQFECAEAVRPEPDVERGVEHEFRHDDGDPVVYENVGSAEYPAPPESMEESAVRDFVEDHEVALRRNALVARYGDRLTSFDAKLDRLGIVDDHGAITTVRVDLFVSDETITDDGEPVVGHGEVAAAYAVDASGAVRADVDPLVALDAGASIAEATPDPIETGELVVCF